MAQELHNEDVWRQCGFTRPLGRQTLDRFITDFVLVAEDVFITLVHELVEQVSDLRCSVELGYGGGMGVLKLG